MALFTAGQLRNRVNDELIKSFRGGGRLMDSTVQGKAKSILNESVNEQQLSRTSAYDIFLSHSSQDAAIVAGLKLEIEDLGYRVYVDWIDDPKLDRAHVTKETALILRRRMKQCKSMIYAFSENAYGSKWMPWELGYFDGIKGTAAVLPIAETEKSSFQGSEYLGIYYYIQIDPTQLSRDPVLWVHETKTKYVLFDDWLGGNSPIQQ